MRFKYLIYVYTNTPPQSKKQYRQKLLKPEAEKWCLKKKNRQKSLKPEAEKWRLDCNIAKKCQNQKLKNGVWIAIKNRQKLLKPETEKWRLDRNIAKKR